MNFPTPETAYESRQHVSTNDKILYTPGQNLMPHNPEVSNTPLPLQEDRYDHCGHAAEDRGVECPGTA